MKNMNWKNKKAFAPMDYIIAMLIFSGVIALLVIAVGSLANDYGKKDIVNEEFSSKFDNFENRTTKAQEIWNATTTGEGLSLVGTVETIFYSTFGVISLITSSVFEAGSQLFNIGEFFGIPNAVSAIFFILIFTTLTVIIIFQILNFVKGTKPL